MNRFAHLGLIVLIILLLISVQFFCQHYFGEDVSGNFTQAAPRQPSSRSVPPKKNNATINVNESSNRLSQSVIDNVKTFVFFLGHARSGHSIVGSLMDSHPHMVISHEFGLFNLLSKKSLAPNKSEIFNALWRNTKESLAPNGLRSNSTSGKGYTLYVDGLYQGRYVDHIDVIGDKKGESTVALLGTNPGKWLNVFKILKSLAGSLKVIHVIRNPYDNIATLICYASGSDHKNFGSFKKSNKIFNVSSKTIVGQIERYFRYFQAIVDAKKKYDLIVVEIHNKNLVSDPRGTLLKICNDLGVTCSDNYLEICGNKIYKTESRTRHMIKWTNEQLKMIQQNIEKYDSLKGYSYDSP